MFRPARIAAARRQERLGHRPQRFKRRHCAQSTPRLNTAGTLAFADKWMARAVVPGAKDFHSTRRLCAQVRRKHRLRLAPPLPGSPGSNQQARQLAGIAEADEPYSRPRKGQRGLPRRPRRRSKALAGRKGSEYNSRRLMARDARSNGQLIPQTNKAASAQTAPASLVATRHHLRTDGKGHFGLRVQRGLLGAQHQAANA